MKYLILFIALNSGVSVLNLEILRKHVKWAEGTAAWAQVHYVHNWMNTGCQTQWINGQQVQICTMTCLIGGETVVVTR